jgi:hypothetical protein
MTRLVQCPSDAVAPAPPCMGIDSAAVHCNNTLRQSWLLYELLSVEALPLQQQ